MKKIKDIGEFGLIDLITRKPRKKDVVVGIGDDAAVIKTKGLQVLTTDCLVEGDHFRRDWFTPLQIGMKAIEISISDVAAMGGLPQYVLISLGLPQDLDVDFVKEIYNGMWKSCKKYDMEIIGGNMTHSDQIFISVTMVGMVEKKNLKLRRGAIPGDFIVVSGHLGFGRAGLRLFQKKQDGFNKVKKRYLEPKARLDYAHQVRSFVNSMIDVSDGLVPEVRHICDQSKCGAIIYNDKIPINDEVRQVAKILNEDEYDYALFGGEDFELVFTVSKNNIDKIDGYLVGEITKCKTVKVKTGNNKKIVTKKGYDHFS